MKNLIAYTTQNLTSNQIIDMFVKGVSKNSNKWNVKISDINEFLRFGFPKNTDAIVVHGILRGTGLAVKEAIKNRIDYFYIDHAYFDAGYKGEFWNRVSKNRHTMNYVREVNDIRWDTIKNNIKIEPWKKNRNRGKNILIIPPTHAIQWFFNDKEWYKNVILYLSKQFDDKFMNRVKVRKKPNDPVVDNYGNLLGFKKIKTENQSSLEEDLNDASIVIAYNSQVALEATIRGIPVIVNKNNSCNEISFKMSDLNYNLNNPVFEEEPNRVKLFKWLSCCQYKMSELGNGSAWNFIEKFQN